MLDTVALSSKDSTTCLTFRWRHLALAVMILSLTGASAGDSFERLLLLLPWPPLTYFFNGLAGMVIVVINSHPLLVLTDLPHFYSRTWYVFSFCVATVANFNLISFLEVNSVFFFILSFKPAHFIRKSWRSFKLCTSSYTIKSTPLWVKVCVPWATIRGR